MLISHSFLAFFTLLAVSWGGLVIKSRLTLENFMDVVIKMLRIRNKDVINGKIDHLDGSQYTEINCSDCNDITELPCWPNILKVDCQYCANLTELPCWPNVRHVRCNNCPKISELPCWPNVLKVNCAENFLTELPLWTEVLEVDCVCCKMTELPCWPKVYKVRCSERARVPDWPKIVDLFLLKSGWVIKIR